MRRIRPEARAAALPVGLQAALRRGPPLAWICRVRRLSGPRSLMSVSDDV